MKKVTMWIASLAVLAAGALQAQDVTGDWLGTIKAGAAEIRGALHISKAPMAASSRLLTSSIREPTAYRSGRSHCRIRS
jgi:hypothetical protein